MSEQSGRFFVKVRFLLRALLFVFLVLVAIFAALENTERIRLSLLGYESVELSLFWWLLIVLVAGLVLGRLSKISTRD